MIDQDSRVPRKRLDARTRVAGGVVTVGDQHQVLELSGSAGDIWRAIDGRRSLRELVTLLMQRYDIDVITAEAAIMDTVAPLAELGLLQLSEPGSVTS